jgi:peptide/nickel transport system permease protein
MTEIASGNVGTPIAPREQQARSKSLTQIAWESFRKHQLAMLGSIILGVMYVGAIFAPFIAPYGMGEYSTTNITRDQPPTTVYFRDPETGVISWPFVYPTKSELDQVSFETKYTEDRTTKFPIKLFITRPDQGGQGRLFGLIPLGGLRLFGVDDPARVYILGSDNYGRDIFSRIMYGAQISLTIGIVANLGAFLLGMLFGGIAGYFGGWVDNIIMRFTEVLSALPTLILLPTLIALLPKDLNPILVFYGVVAALSLLAWGDLARVIRSQIFSIREQDYAQAAIALGASESRVIFRHILPATFTYLIVSASLAIPGYILAESALSFIGYGIREPQASWGLMLQAAQEAGFAALVLRPWLLVPGFFIVLAVLCWNFVGDGMRDAFDPKKRQG